MNIVLTCIDNFQDYILTNIQQLIRLNHQNIYVICNSHMFDKFEGLNVILIDHQLFLEKEDIISNFVSKSTLDKDFRNGFWYLTSLRFFYIYEFMKKYDVKDIIHLENDVPIYYNCDELLNLVDKNYMYIPFDTYNRNIASIVYIPNKEIYKQILDNYDFNINDMDNFAIIKQKTGLIKNFPIFIKNENLSDEQNFVSTNSERFPFIFDAAAIGQYLGGVDPRNEPGDTTGFINETCVIKYNNYTILFKTVNDIKKPFIMIEDNCIPIFNLHIHSKNLKKFL